MPLKKKERKKIVSVKANIIVTLLCNSKSYFLPLKVYTYFTKVYRCPSNTVSSIKCRVLICCTCNFQSGSPFFIVDSSVCKSLQCLISALTQGGEGDHLFGLTGSVVLWGGRSPLDFPGKSTGVGCHRLL